MNTGVGEIVDVEELAPRHAAASVRSKSTVAFNIARPLALASKRIP
jgi:hypothetical protein